MESIIHHSRRGDFAKAVRLGMARKGFIRRSLAKKTGCTERVLGKLLAAESVHNTTIANVAQELEIDLEAFSTPALLIEREEPDASFSVDDLGGYTLEKVEDFIGTYLAYRYAFNGGPGIVRSQFDFEWNAQMRWLRFRETQCIIRNGRDVELQHAGWFHFSQFRLIHLMSRHRGSVRLITLHPPEIGERDLRGVTLTPAECTPIRGPSYYLPGISPIILKRAEAGDARSPTKGRLAEEATELPSVLVELREIEEKLMRAPSFSEFSMLSSL